MIDITPFQNEITELKTQKKKFHSVFPFALAGAFIGFFLFSITHLIGGVLIVLGVALGAYAQFNLDKVYKREGIFYRDSIIRNLLSNSFTVSNLLLNTNEMGKFFGGPELENPRNISDGELICNRYIIGGQARTGGCENLSFIARRNNYRFDFYDLRTICSLVDLGLCPPEPSHRKGYRPSAKSLKRRRVFATFDGQVLVFPINQNIARTIQLDCLYNFDLSNQPFFTAYTFLPVCNIYEGYVLFHCAVKTIDNKKYSVIL